MAQEPAPSPKRLLIGVPLHHGESRVFRHGCLDLVHRRLPGWAFTFREVGDCGIVTARDLIAAECIVHKYDALLFLATDIGFTAEHVRRICSHFGTGPDIVGGCYTVKTFPLRLVFTPIPGIDTDPATGLVRVWETGTDFLFISRAAMEKVIATHPGLEYERNDGGEHLGPIRWNLFNMGVHQEGPDAPAPLRGRRRHLTEDYWWCKLAREAGIPTYVDTEVRLDHDGRFLYRANDLMKGAPPASSTPPSATA